MLFQNSLMLVSILYIQGKDLILLSRNKIKLPKESHTTIFAILLSLHFFLSKCIFFLIPFLSFLSVLLPSFEYKKNNNNCVFISYQTLTFKMLNRCTQSFSVQPRLGKDINGDYCDNFSLILINQRLAH